MLCIPSYSGSQFTFFCCQPCNPHCAPTCPGLLHCLEWRHPGDIIAAIENFCPRYPGPLRHLCRARALSVARALAPYTELPVAGEECHQTTQWSDLCSGLWSCAAVSSSERPYS